VSFCTDAVSAEATNSIPISVAFFEDVAGKNRSNIESIITVQGDVEIDAYQYETEKITSFRKSKTFFAVDKKSNNRLSLRSLDKNVQLENGVEKKKGYCTIDGYLYVGDVAYWYYAANPNVGDPEIDPQNHASVVGNIRIDQRDVRQHDNSRLPEYFDPFNHMIPSRSAPSGAMLIAAKVLSDQLTRPTYSVTQAGNFLTVKEESTLGSKPAGHLYVFDTTKSHYLIEYETRMNDSCLMHWKCEPVLVDGIWFPSTVSEVTVNGKYKKEYRFSNVKINKKIPDKVFTLQFLGVRQQDFVYDTRTQTKSQIEDTAFPLPEYLKNLEKKSMSKSKWIFIGTGLFLIFLSLYRLFSQWRKKKILENTQSLK
jgi:hypothetical protein